MFTNLINDLVERFGLLRELGFSVCYKVNEQTGTKHLVHSLNSPENGFSATDIINMSSADFLNLVNNYVN